MSSEVYFLRPIGQEGPVKIGSTRDPRRRLKEYLAWSPFPLEIAATLPGDIKLERRFHAYFADDWTHHEWFKPSARLSIVILAINRGTFNEGLLPEKGIYLGSLAERALPRHPQAFRIRGARMTYGHVKGRCKATPPPEVQRAYDQLYDLHGAEFDDALELVHRWSYQPYEHGTVAAADLEAAAKYRATFRYRQWVIGPNALPSLEVAA